MDRHEAPLRRYSSNVDYLAAIAALIAASWRDLPQNHCYCGAGPRVTAFSTVADAVDFIGLQWPWTTKLSIDHLLAVGAIA